MFFVVVRPKTLVHPAKNYVQNKHVWHVGLVFSSLIEVLHVLIDDITVIYFKGLLLDIRPLDKKYRIIFVKNYLKTKLIFNITLTLFSIEQIINTIWLWWAWFEIAGCITWYGSNNAVVVINASATNLNCGVNWIHTQ